MEYKRSYVVVKKGVQGFFSTNQICKKCKIVDIRLPRKNKITDAIIILTGYGGLEAQPVKISTDISSKGRNIVEEISGTLKMAIQGDWKLDPNLSREHQTDVHVFEGLIIDNNNTLYRIRVDSLGISEIFYQLKTERSTAKAPAPVVKTKSAIIVEMKPRAVGYINNKPIEQEMEIAAIM